MINQKGTWCKYEKSRFCQEGECNTNCVIWKQKDFVQITPREREILQGIVEGKSNKELGKENTVKTQIHMLFLKFDVSTRTELVITAIRKGMVTV
jgi:DNA-binding NarL/FixJ family response regulator